MKRLKEKANHIILHRWFPVGYVVGMVALLIVIFSLLGGGQ